MFASPLFRLGLQLWGASIQERIFSPNIPIERVIPVCDDGCIHMNIRNILSLWVFDASARVGSVRCCCAAAGSGCLIIQE